MGVGLEAEGAGAFLFGGASGGYEDADVGAHKLRFTVDGGIVDDLADEAVFTALAGGFLYEGADFDEHFRGSRFWLVGTTLAGWEMEVKIPAFAGMTEGGRNDRSGGGRVGDGVT